MPVDFWPLRCCTATPNAGRCRAFHPEDPPLTSPTISLVIPAFNEAAAIGWVVASANEAFPDFHEVIVIDDGSDDETAKVAEDAGARVVRLGANYGKGVALRRGIQEANGEILLFIDADGQDDPAEIPAVIGPLVEDESLGMVIGSRFQGTFHEGSITRLNHYGNRGITWLFNKLYGARLTDTQAGFRALRHRAVDLSALSAVRYEIETELTLHVLRRGERVIEVPVSRAARVGGATGFEVARDGLRILRLMTTRRIAARFQQ